MIEIKSVTSQAYTSVVLKLVDSKDRPFYVRVDADKLVLNTKEDFTGRHAYVSPDDLFELAKSQGRQAFGKAKVFRPKEPAKSGNKLVKIGAKS